MATKQRNRVRKSKSNRSTKCVLQKPRGVIAPQVAHVGVDKFGIVCVDPAKKRSWWMMAVFLGQVVIEPVADAPSAEKLRPLLIDAGKNPRGVFVVEAGADYPQFATILNFCSHRESRAA